jgi:hypothetical protein
VCSTCRLVEKKLQHLAEYLVLWNIEYSFVILSIGGVELNVTVLYVVTYYGGLT